MSAEREKICPSCGARYHSAATFCQADGRALVIAELTRDPLLGQVLLDQFRIEEKIGSGGMGTVYRAHQTSIGRDVAVKVLHPELAQNAEAIRRFQREARVATSLDHPNVVRVFLYGDLPDRTLYLVMEHLEGRPLLDLLGQGPLPLERALHIATQICDGVGEAHARGIVHRDIKPENILIVRRGADPDFVKVLDFGIARVLWDEHTQVTQSGMIFGTAKYISPEGASGEATDMRSDVYSIAVLAYQLLTGEVPFSGRTPVSLLMKHIHQPAADIRTQPGGRHVPPPVADVVMRALAKNPDARHATSTELGLAFREAALAAGVALHPLMARHAFDRSSDPSSPLAPAASLAAASGVIASPAPVPLSSSALAASQGAALLEDAELDTAAIPGLPGSRRHGPMPYLLAFLLGAALVGAGAFLLFSPAEAPSEVELLESRAAEALARGDLDAPRGENVAELLERLAILDPASRTAQEVRREAVLLLRERAAAALGRQQLDAAEGAYALAARLAPDDHELASRVEELRARRRLAAATIPLEPGIQLADEAIELGVSVALVGILPEGLEVPEGERPRFEIRRGSRRVATIRAERAADPLRWEARYVFGSAGAHEIRFELEHEGTLLEYRAPVQVSRGRAPARPALVRRQPASRPEAADAPLVEAAAPEAPVGLQPIRAIPASDDGIDWGVPAPPPEPETPRPPPPPAETVPAPWTGAAEVL